MAVFWVTFGPAYFGADAIVSRLGWGWRYYFDWETGIPLIAPMIIPYLSLFPLFLLPLLYLSPQELGRLSRQSTATIAVAFLGFVLAPGVAGFPPAEPEGAFSGIYDLVHRVYGQHNMAPSLHVAFAALLLLACGERASRLEKWFCRIWLATLSASTVLTHQHHLLDVVTGLGLALAVRAMLPLDKAERPEQRPEPAGFQIERCGEL